MQKGILYSYILILILSIALLISGYSFSWKPLNSFLITVIIVYPVVRFFVSPMFAWVKLVLTILAVILIGFIGYRVLLILAFTSGERTIIQKWRSSEYKMTYTRRLDWAGPPYYTYELYHTLLGGLLIKKVGIAYLEPNKKDSCKVKFEDLYSSKNDTLEYDTCMNRVSRRK